jgi:hypothetical protein
MPYTLKQRKLFQAAAHNPAISKKTGITPAEAKKMLSHGIKRVTRVDGTKKR